MGEDENGHEVVGILKFGIGKWASVIVNNNGKKETKAVLRKTVKLVDDDFEPLALE